MSGVTKTVADISPQLCAKAPTPDNADHSVEFNNNN